MAQFIELRQFLLLNMAQFERTAPFGGVREIDLFSLTHALQNGFVTFKNYMKNPPKRVEVGLGANDLRLAVNSATA